METSHIERCYMERRWDMKLHMGIAQGEVAHEETAYEENAHELAAHEEKAHEEITNVSDST